MITNMQINIEQLKERALRKIMGTKGLQSWRFEQHPFVIRSDEGITLETSAL